jgi:hypothetical protein
LPDCHVTSAALVMPRPALVLPRPQGQNRQRAAQPPEPPPPARQCGLTKNPHYRRQASTKTLPTRRERWEGSRMRNGMAASGLIHLMVNLLENSLASFLPKGQCARGTVFQLYDPHRRGV